MLISVKIDSWLVTVQTHYIDVLGYCDKLCVFTELFNMGYILVLLHLVLFLPHI